MSKPSLEEHYKIAQNIIEKSRDAKEIDEAEEALLQMWKDHPKEMGKITTKDFLERRDNPASIMTREEAGTISARATAKPVEASQLQKQRDSRTPQ